MLFFISYTDVINESFSIPTGIVLKLPKLSSTYSSVTLSGSIGILVALSGNNSDNLLHTTFRYSTIFSSLYG